MGGPRARLYSDIPLAFPQGTSEYVGAVAVAAKARHIDNEADRTEHRNAWRSKQSIPLPAPIARRLELRYAGPKPGTCMPHGGGREQH